MRTILLMKMALLIALNLNGQNVTGDWYGAVGSGNNTIQFVFHLSKDDTLLKVTMDIPGRNLSNIKTQQTTFNNGELHIDGRNFGFEYFGQVDSTGTIIEGKFKEGIHEIPLELTREKPRDVLRKKRPQEPSRPYPYHEEEVTFNNESAGIRLAGTLTWPKGQQKVPAVILITGSGPQNRDEEIFGHKPFLVLADHLTRLGIAVLRYDDRGVNESTGNFTDATTADFAVDVQSAIDYLKTREEIDSDQIGLVGHSEGGIIAPMVAANSSDVDFMVIMAGTGVSGFETSLIQSVTMRGFDVPDEKAFKAYMTEVLKIASADKPVEEVRRELRDYYDKSPFFNAVAGTGDARQQVLDDLVATRTSKWIRYFYDYNPADMLKSVKCPVLSINGTKDIQVLADVNQQGIKKALEKAENKDFEIMALEGLNHFFQEAQTGEMREYAEIEQTISPKALQVISDWILKHID